MTLNRFLLVVLPIVMVASLVGWIADAVVADDEAAGQNQATPSKLDAGAASGDGGGVLMGRAVFEGSVPPPRKLVVDKDADLCKGAEGEVQSVVVGKDKALAGVVVEIQGIKNKGDRKWQHPEGGYVIRQKGCRFLPSFLVVPNGQDLTIYNDDPMLHNVNTAQWNIAQPGGENYMSKKKIAYQGRPFVRVNCNVHSWMEGWIYVARTPYYAVTGADGKFKIEGIPAGSYKVTARHPKLRTQRFKITIEEGKTAEQEITFQPRSG